MALNGFLLIDKEQDWTSSDVVAKLRGILREKRIGHAGTLDPMATGLLVVMVGKSAKASEYIMHKDKEYIATLKLGVVTDTQDIWGTVLEKNDVAVTEKQLKNVLESFKGDISQIPPMYSAIKIKGQKLYNIARRGEEIEREPRTISVGAIEILSGEGDEYVLRIECSSGTYVRTLCHDIGAALGCGGCMSALRRVRIGNASVEDAHRISEITDGSYIIPPEQKFFELPEKIQLRISRDE